MIPRNFVMYMSGTNITSKLQFILLFCFIMTVLSAAKEQKHKHSNDKFQSGKVNQLWEKAKKMNLPSVTMADLYVELNQHDHELMELKSIKAQGKDEEGMMQAKLQKEFNGIMFKYGLAGNTEDQLVKHNFQIHTKSKEPFQDRKLNALWKDVLISDEFSPNELTKLFLEFKHLEDKLVELNSLRSEVKDVESTNSVDESEQDNVKQTFSKMKDLIEEVDQGYRKIYAMTKKSKDESLPFTEPRVLDLWNLMKRYNFSDAEKKSFEEELRHFEKRIEKHRHFRNELKNAAEKVEFHGGREDASTDKVIRHDKLQTKVQDLADKMHKVYINLKSRLKGGVVVHNEL